MLKGNDIVGKPVLDSNDRQPIKKVEELIFDPYHSQVLGFLLHKGGWAGGALALLWPNVLAVSPEAVIARSGDLIVEARWTVEIKQVLEVNERLMGRRMATTDGRDLGTVTDLFFDPQTGAIEGYEVAGGAFADSDFAAPSTRTFAPAPPQLTIEADAALVPPVVAQRMEERADAARARRAGCGEALEAARGLRVRRAVRSRGRYVAAQGQIVTDAVIKRARALQQEAALWKAVGCARAEARDSLSAQS
ncbi:MAG: hypothetical protein Kow00120_24340 [Anaerolineae bacterium]